MTAHNLIRRIGKTKMQKWFSSPPLSLPESMQGGPCYLLLHILLMACQETKWEPFGYIADMCWQFKKKVHIAWREKDTLLTFYIISKRGREKRISLQWAPLYRYVCTYCEKTCAEMQTHVLCECQGENSRTCCFLMSGKIFIALL